jgi:acetyltransferase-like isoleucine patch superfamily enzyme
MGSDYLEPRINNLFKFQKKGYALREIVLKGISLKIISKIFSFLRYGFYYRGRGVDIDYRSVVDGAKYISMGDRVWLQRGAWLSVPLFEMDNVEKRAYLVIGEGTRIGPNCTISAANKIHIGKNVLFGPNVTIVDHMHQYINVHQPVSHQGILGKGEIIMEDDSWIGVNVTIYAHNKKIIIGKGSVIAANSVIRNNVEPYSVVSGNPARLIKKYDPATNRWERIGKGSP